MTKKASTKLFFLGLIALVTRPDTSFAQQNIQLTQYTFNSLSINPAYTGYKEEWFVQMALRNQWTGIDDAPQTGQVSIDGILDPTTKKTGIGLQIGADKLGPQSSTSAYVNYAYRLRLNAEGTSRLSFGLGAGISQFSLNYSKLSPIDNGDEYATQGEANKLVPNFRFGIYYYSPKWYIGASMLDLLTNTSNTTNSKGVLPNKRHLYLISGTIFDITSDTKLRPGILLKEDFRGPTSLDLNSMIIFKETFWLGASYRTGLNIWTKPFERGQETSNLNSVAAIAQFFVNSTFRIGYSYDYTTSQLSSIEGGSHEISLGLTFIKRPGRKMLTPRFF